MVLALALPQAREAQRSAECQRLGLLAARNLGHPLNPLFPFACWPAAPSLAVALPCLLRRFPSLRLARRDKATGRTVAPTVPGRRDVLPISSPGKAHAELP